MHDCMEKALEARTSAISGHHIECLSKVRRISISHERNGTTRESSIPPSLVLIF